MRVLSISTDRGLLDKGTTVFKRHCAYAEEFDGLDIFVLGGEGEMREGTLFTRGVGSGWAVFRGAHALFAASRWPKPDVITVQDPFENGFIAWLIAKWFKVPLHVQVHTDFLSTHFARHSVLNRMRRLIALFVLRRAARIRVVSELIKESLHTTNYKLPALSVLPIYVDTEKYANLTRTKHPRFKLALLWIGRLEKEKNPLLAIQLLEIVRKNGHDAGLMFVGIGAEEDGLRNYVRARGLERYVEFTGWKDDLTDSFSVADVMLVTSTYEGYGMAMIEALAASVPVLSLDVGVARESGAIVVGKQKEMGRALLDWIAHGPRTATLQNYPYESLDEYVHAWCDDVRAASHLS